MEVLPSRPEISPKAALFHTVMEIHRSCAIEAYGQLGLDLREWDSNAVREFTPTPQQKDSLLLVIGDVEYGDKVENTVYSSNILGSKGFKLKYSYTPLKFLDEHIARNASSGTYEIVNVEAPFKVIGIELESADESTKPSFEQAKVFLSPDMPPVAILDKYLIEASKLTGLDDEDIRIVNNVEQTYGSDVVEYLDDNACLELIYALQNERARTSSHI